MAETGASDAAAGGRDVAGLERWARVYAAIGAIVLLGLVAIGVLGYYGQDGPGVLTGDQAAFVFGASIAVLGVASVFLLFSLRHTLILAKAWRAAADSSAQKVRDLLQDAETEALRREQDFRDRDQEGRFGAELRAMEERLARRIDREAA
ncbi:MAG: hypothetical protein ACREI7_11600, partial [Myxococcota bacterium]